MPPCLPPAFFAVVGGLMVWSVVRYRDDRSGTEPARVHGSRTVEVVPIYGYRTLVFAFLRDRLAVVRRLGPPHVHHRPGQPDLVLGHDLPHRRPHRDQVLQLDRHHVGGRMRFPTPHAVRPRVPADLPARRHHRGVPGLPPIDFHLHDTPYVVAHFHLVMLAALQFGLFAGI
jgi:hypothetical protein